MSKRIPVWVRIQKIFSTRRVFHSAGMCLLEAEGFYPCGQVGFAGIGIEHLAMQQFCTGAARASFSLVLPMSLPPDVAKDDCFTLQIIAFRNVVMIVRQYTADRVRQRWCRIRPCYHAWRRWQGERVGSLISMVLRDFLSIQFRSALVYGTLAGISKMSAPIASARFFNNRASNAAGEE